MDTAISRRAGILVACLMAIAWAKLAPAESIKVQVQLSGSQEVPPVQTSGTGTADLTYDPSTRVVTWTIIYSGLSGTATMAHFHGPAGKLEIWLVSSAVRWCLPRCDRGHRKLRARQGSIAPRRKKLGSQWRRGPGQNPRLRNG